MNNSGERIYNLRVKNNMSQGNLADKLNVSRQTVSKWENGICMPDSEKLIQLSEIFDVSTDFILKGEDLKPTSERNIETENKTVAAYNERIIRKYVGIILAVIFSIVTLWVLLWGGFVVAPMTACIVLLGILLAKNVKHPWLITFWSIYIIAMIILIFCTSINPFTVFDTIIYKEGYTVHLLLAYGVWAIFAILVICTVKVIKKSK